MTEPTFDTHKFLTENWTDADSLYAFMGRYGVASLTPPAVGKWFARRSVPARWLPVLLALLEIDKGTPLSVVPYIKE